MARKRLVFYRRVQFVLIGILGLMAVLGMQLLPIASAFGDHPDLAKNLTPQPPSLQGKGEKEIKFPRLGKGEKEIKFPRLGKGEKEIKFPPPRLGEGGRGERFFELAQNPSNPGIDLYKMGRFSEAIASWEKELREVPGDERNRALVWNYLSLAYQQLGQWEKAKEAIARSLNLLESAPDSEILARSLTTKGRLELARGEAETALDSFKQAEKIYQELDDEEGAIGSQINQTQALQNLGRYRLALKTLDTVRENLENQPDSIKIAGFRSLGNTYRFLGDLEKSQEVLQKSREIAQRSQSSQEESAILLSLGDTKRALGNQRRDNPEFRDSIKLTKYFNYQKADEEAVSCYKQAWEDYQNADKIMRSPYQESDKEALSCYEKALEDYQNADKIARSPMAKLQAKLNSLSLLVEIYRWLPKQIESRQSSWSYFSNIDSQAEDLSRQIWSEIDNLSASQTAIYTRINFARNLARVPAIREWDKIEQLLTKTIADAVKLKDERAETYAIGTLGWLYEQKQDWLKATEDTQQALNKAKAIQAEEIVYQWQWQMGRIFKEEGKREDAIASYTEAVETIQKIRKDLVGIDFGLIDSVEPNRSINSNIQFNFRDKVEPVYREVVDLLLSPEKDRLNEQKNIQKALTVIEWLQVAELENFLRCELEEDSPKETERLSESKTLKEASEQVEKELNNIHEKDRSAAVIYPIILPDRLEVVLSLPGPILSHYSSSIPASQVKKTLDELQFLLRNRPLSVNEVQQQSQELYKWLIKPINSKLEKDATLVFGLDTLLRNIPMSVLHDGTQYLVEKNSIVLIPRLQLRESNRLPENPEALTAGLIEPPPNSNFTKLKHVREELEEIGNVVTGTELRDRRFTNTTIQEKMNSRSFVIVHLATHGRFSSNPNQTYIKTWDNEIKVSELQNLLQSRTQNIFEPIELLVLSACETAEGDSRATLGLAGMAVRAGARSTIGSLWQVDDKSTADLMGQFYTELVKNKEPRAKALRKAQQSLLGLTDDKKNRPYYWAPFVLVGNWL